eukprot:6491505-Amphidinium_carterae.2
MPRRQLCWRPGCRCSDPRPPRRGLAVRRRRCLQLSRCPACHHMVWMPSVAATCLASRQAH